MKNFASVQSVQTTHDKTVITLALVFVMFCLTVGDSFLFITKTCPCNIQGFFSAVKIEIFIEKKNIFNIVAQNIDCGFSARGF